MPSVADFLIDRMDNAGIRHVFGVPGDYVLNFYKKLDDYDNIKLINATDENHAGFAADAYARVNGIGCVCVTYNVGALKISNAVACAYAERSPLVVISGSPGMKERKEGIMLHHMVRSFDCQREVFEKITCASTVLDNPNVAGFEIDRVFEALNHHKLPVYIELPRDIATKPVIYDVYNQGTPTSPETDEQNLEEAIEEVVGWLNTAKRPIIMAGVQVSRFGLGSQLVRFAEKTNIPIVTTLLSKSVVSEIHPLFRGLYAGSTSQEGVQEAVEESDCLLMFGVLVTDMTTSFMPVQFNKRRTVSCSIEGMKVKNHAYANVMFKDFCHALFKSDVVKKISYLKPTIKIEEKFTPSPDDKITTKRFYQKINSILDEKTTVLADTGDTLFGALDLICHHNNSFLCPAFYTSMGFAIPGALGVQTAQPHIRPIVLVGDGAFQMSCTELSTIVDRGLNPIVFVINNKGYVTERMLLDGPFNDVRNWKYHEVVEMIDGGIGLEVFKEGDLDKAISIALDSDELVVINVHIDPDDISPALKRMAVGLSKRI